MNSSLKFINVGAFSPNLEIGNPIGNCENITKLITKYKEDVDIFVFPELCITGYTCGDLFLQSNLYESAIMELWRMTLYMKNYLSDSVKGKLIVLGCPIKKDNQLFNCAVYLYDGEILGFVPKTYIPNHNEFCESRWFSSANDRLSDTITINGHVYPFTPNFLVNIEELGLSIATEIGDNLHLPIPTSSNHCMYGANLILNLAASNELVAKSTYRRKLISMQSSKCICGYVYASAGTNESTTDVVFSGHKIIASNGDILAENRYDKEVIISTIDIEKLNNNRVRISNFTSSCAPSNYVIVTLNQFYNLGETINKHYLEVDPYPFIPNNEKQRKERCDEIVNIQAMGLAQRMKKTGIRKLVIGISGGLDSTLALLVAIRTMDIIGEDYTNIIGLTMPGFGTTKQTLNNSIMLMEKLRICLREISIVDACTQHLKDIGHSLDEYDSTYENVQARERTQILMDVANELGALVVGTGDLSELILGWCTYNGDHMSMYSVNADIPKTLVRYLIQSIALDYKEKSNQKVYDILMDICDTPISPELLPTDKDGNMVQKTEETIGKYDLHDFFLYHTLRNNFSPTKIFYLATLAFKDLDKKIIKDTMLIFYRRFFTQQFKRSCLPDGPKVGTVGISPRGDLKMPSDACAKLWVKEVESIYLE